MMYNPLSLRVDNRVNNRCHYFWAFLYPSSLLCALCELHIPHLLSYFFLKYICRVLLLQLMLVAEHKTMQKTGLERVFCLSPTYPFVCCRFCLVLLIIEFSYENYQKCIIYLSHS